MAPLNISEEHVTNLKGERQIEEVDNQGLELHPEAYKVKGPSPEKMKSVSPSLRIYASGLYGLL